MGVTFAVETNIGNKRQVNEDSFWPQPPQHDHQPNDPYGMLFIVADGMGGHGAGDIASATAVAAISTTYYSLGAEYTSVGDRLTRAIEQAHKQIRERATESPRLENMGTTVVAVVVKYDEVYEQGEVWVAWAGDSRVYLLRGGRLQQLTRDHSRVWSLIEAGQISWDQLRFHPERSRVTNALTARRPTVTPEVERYELEPGDVLLLCSDGLSGEVKPDDLEQTLARYPSPQVLPLLIEKANGPKEVDKAGQRVVLEGGNDNITALLIEIPGDTTTQTVSLPPVPIPQAMPARPVRLGWVIGVSLMVLGLSGVGLALFLFGLDSSGSDSLSGIAAAPPPTTPAAPAAQATANAGSTVVSVTIIDKTTATDTPASTATQAVSLTEEARLPTVTRGPLSSPTLPSTATPPPTLSPTPTQATTATVTATLLTSSLVITPGTYPPPTLVEPQPYELSKIQQNSQEVTFVWAWPGELSDQLSFEIRLWLEGDEPQGVYDAKELKHNPTFVSLGEHQYAVTLKLTAPAVKGSSSDYLWSVAVVQVMPTYRWLGIESEPRRISVLVSTP